MIFYSACSRVQIFAFLGQSTEISNSTHKNSRIKVLWYMILLLLHALQMLPLLKESIDNLVAVLREKAKSGESFDALKYVLP